MFYKDTFIDGYSPITNFLRISKEANILYLIITLYSELSYVLLKLQAQLYIYINKLSIIFNQWMVGLQNFVH